MMDRPVGTVSLSSVWCFLPGNRDGCEILRKPDDGKGDAEKIFVDVVSKTSLLKVHLLASRCGSGKSGDIQIFKNFF